MNLTRNSIRCLSPRIACLAFVFVSAGYSLSLYAGSRGASRLGDNTIAVAGIVSPSPSPTPAPEIVPQFAEVVIADQIRRTVPTSSPTITANANARAGHRVNELQAEFDGLDGSDVEVAVFDNGPVRATHKEFRLDINNETTSRIKFRVQAIEPFDGHATHVAGTMGAAGATHDGRVKGMAPRLKTIYSENMRQDLEGLAALSGRANISNHSYTPNAGWARDSRSNLLVWYGDESVDPNEDIKFGKYTSKEERFDDFVYRSKKFMAFAAAGNDREDSPEEISGESQPADHFVFDPDSSGQMKARKVKVSRRPDGFDSEGLDTVVGICVAKNSICIGAIPDIPTAASATSLESIKSASYSNWGPTDDGRIKPDLVATGNDLLSTSDADDEAIFRDSGTSMASPTAAGIAALLIQLYRRERNEDPFASIIKAVLIHTARDAGQKGPDPVFGWGAIDALAAGRVIGQKDRHIIMRRALSLSNPVYELLLEPSNASDQIKVTVVWTDPPGAANTGGLDDSAPALMNDLDVKLTAPDGTTVFWPYSLNRQNPLQAATKIEANHVDNVEVIDGVGSAPGKWKLEIKAAGFKAGSEQDFAVVITGLRAATGP